MLPIPDGAYVTGEFIQDWHTLRDRDAYIVLTRDDGIVFKVVENKIKEQGKLIMHSLNPLYEPYDIAIGEVKEIWKFVNYISPEIPETNKIKENLAEELVELKKQVKAIQMKLNL